MSDPTSLHRPARWKPWFYRLLSFYPPYLGAGIRIAHVAPDLTSIEVRMKLRFWNRNAVGTHFGGSLYSMVDPFYMLLLMEALGPGYIVWDKAAAIRFKRPGRGTVSARFHLPAERVAEIRAAADAEGKIEPELTVDIHNAQGEIVAQVDKLLYVRKKKPSPGLSPSPAGG